jgi:hypothetical protein
MTQETKNKNVETLNAEIARRLEDASKLSLEELSGLATIVRDMQFTDDGEARTFAADRAQTTAFRQAVLDSVTQGLKVLEAQGAERLTLQREALKFLEHVVISFLQRQNEQKDLFTALLPELLKALKPETPTPKAKPKKRSASRR